MKEILEIRNFGPIKKLNVEIKPLTLFIGTQGSGKSTISKLLTICRDMRWYLEIINNKDYMKPFYDFSIVEYFQDDTYIHYYHEGLEIEIFYESGKFSLRINGYSADEAKTWVNEHISEFNAFFATPNGKNDTSDEIVKKLQQANSRMMLYIPAERNLIGNLSSALASIMLARIPLSDTIIEYMSLFEKAKKEFPRYEIPFLGVHYEKKEGKEKIILDKNGKELPLSACSSGLQSVLPMIMVIDYALKTDTFNNFVIEEPEQNLFPENQCELLRFICSKKEATDFTGFVITTHSPYLLSCLNVLILAAKLVNDETIKEEVKSIVPEKAMVNSENVAVYSLDPDADEDNYCRSIIAERTGLVSVNELDSISEYIGEDYDRLYRLFLKSKRK